VVPEEVIVSCGTTTGHGRNCSPRTNPPEKGIPWKHPLGRQQRELEMLGIELAQAHAEFITA
jgi:hypothetical protein